MPNIGPLELAILLLIILVIFGPKRLPGLGRQLGSGMREFKDSITGKDRGGDEDEEDEEDDRRRHIDPAPASEAEDVRGEARPQDQPVTRADL